MKILFLFCTVIVLGCSSVLPYLDGGGDELVPGTFYHEPLKVTTRYSKNPSTDPAYRRKLNRYHDESRHSYCFSIDGPRLIQYIYLDIPGDPVTNLEIYTRLTDADRWKRVKQLKSPVGANTRIDLNVRASEIRVIQKTVSLRREANDTITGFRVYAQEVK